MEWMATQQNEIHSSITCLRSKTISQVMSTRTEPTAIKVKKYSALKCTFILSLSSQCSNIIVEETGESV